MKTNELTQELKRALSTESAFYEEETVAYIDGLEFALKIVELCKTNGIDMAEG